MIFNNNSTSLGTMSIPMAEGYDGSCGAALALLESARNDYAMFRAMLDSDARELAIRNESSGYVAESAISALHESTGKGIWTKIKEFFAKVCAKIKSIVHNFIIRFKSLFADSKTLVQKYKQDILKKGENIDKLEIKWRQTNNFDNINDLPSVAEVITLNGIDEGWTEDIEGRWKKVTTHSEVTDESSYREYLTNEFWEDTKPETYKVSEIGGRLKLIRTFEGYSKIINDFNTTANKITQKYAELVKNAEKKVNEEAGKKDFNSEDLKKANKAYDMAQIYSQESLTRLSVIMSILKIDYAQHKAAFVKMATANPDKLKENAIYLDAVAEAAEQEVEDVISGALSKEELSDICNASKNVVDSDVSDDPGKLTYGPDGYTDNLSYVRTDGTVDTDINSKEESAFFGELIY